MSSETRSTLAYIDIKYFNNLAGVLWEMKQEGKGWEDRGVVGGMGSGATSCEVPPGGVCSPLWLVCVTDLGAGTLCCPSKSLRPPFAHRREV